MISGTGTIEDVVQAIKLGAWDFILIHWVIAEAMELLRPNCNNIKLLTDCRADKHEILGDATLLANALINLGLNARDAIPGSESLTIRTNVVKSDSNRRLACGKGPDTYIRIQVIDTGSGMDSAVMSRLFEPLFTTKVPGKGNGLGLSSVRRCVKLHKGFIGVESTVGKGTTFTIWLPLLWIAGQSKPVTPTAKILVIDDENFARLLIKHNLEELGYEVVVMGRIMESIEFLRMNPAGINLALIDYDMSPLNGRKIFRELIKINPALKALFMISNARNPEEKETWEAGIAGTIAKPFNQEQICMTITKVLSPRQPG